MKLKMINSEKQIYIQETEIKPNHAAVIVLCVTLLFSVACWLVNELGIFRVDDRIMRIGSIICVVAIAVPLLMILFDRNQYNSPRMKYIMMGSVIAFTFDISTLLTFHTEIMLLFPIFFAMLYRSRLLGKIALVASVLCTIFAPILGYILGVWDVPLFEELILIATGGTTQIINPTYRIEWIGIGKILLYITLPRLMMVGACATLMFRVITISADHVKSEILLNRINNRDNLTGLFNQNYYNEYLANPKDSGTTGVIFFDVNGLKAANDKNGHEYGDLLLKRCAQSILNICEDSTSIAFRLGGDEFLMVIEGATEPVIIQKIAEWKSAIEIINRENMVEYDGLYCSMAIGYAIGASTDIENTIRKADALMYENKALMKSKIVEFGSVE